MTVCSQFEDAAKEAADEATSPRPLGEEEVEDIQVMLKMEGNCIQIRQLKVGSWYTGVTSIAVYCAEAEALGKGNTIE